MPEFPQAFGGYVLLKLLATGSSGEIFLARPIDLRRDLPSPLVVKRLHHDLAEDETFRRRFRQEAEIAVSVTSPHVARVFDAGRVGDSYYIAMEYIPGWTLARVMADLRSAGRAASMDSIRDIASDALEGLAALHSARDVEEGSSLGIVHRDISPRNLMVGEDSITRLIDFGAGKAARQEWRTAAGVILGASGYLSPEQASGLAADRRTDLYALSIIIWELLTSRRYFDPAPAAELLARQREPVFRPPSAYRGDVTPEMDALLERALARDPRMRPFSATQLRGELLEVFGAREIDRSSSTLVGAMLWGELGDSRTELTRLLSAPSGPLEPAIDETWSLTAPSAQLLDPMGSSSTERGPLVGSVPLVSPGSAAVMRPRPSMLWIFGPTIAAMLVTFVITTALIARKRAASVLEPPAARALEVEPAPRAVKPSGVQPPGAQAPGVQPPGVQAVGAGTLEPRAISAPQAEGSRSLEDEPVEDPTDTLAEDPPTEDAPRAGRRTRGRRPHDREPRPTEVEAAALDATELGALIERAQALERKVAPGSEDARAASRLIRDLSMEMGRKQVDPARARTLLDELRRLEGR